MTFLTSKTATTPIRGNGGVVFSHYAWITALKTLKHRGNRRNLLVEARHEKAIAIQHGVLVNSSSTRLEKGRAWIAMCSLIRVRSSAQIERMEKERGLRSRAVQALNGLSRRDCPESWPPKGAA